MNFSQEQISQIKDILKKQLAIIDKSFDDLAIYDLRAIEHFIEALDKLPDPRQEFKASAPEREATKHKQALSEIEAFYESLKIESNIKYRANPEQRKKVLRELNKQKEAEVKSLTTRPEQLQLERLVKSQSSKIEGDFRTNLFEAVKTERLKKKAKSDDETIQDSIRIKLIDSARAAAHARAKQINELEHRLESIKNKGGRIRNVKVELVYFHLLKGLDRLRLKPLSTSEGWTYKLMEIAFKRHRLPVGDNGERHLARAIAAHQKRVQTIKIKKSLFR